MVQKKNLIGNRYGYLTVVEEADDLHKLPNYTGVTWECKCDCGTVCYARGNKLLLGLKKSCGCKKYSINSISNKQTARKLAEARIGTKNNFLTITGISDNTFNSGHGYIYKCKCDCGNEIEVRSSNLKGQISCGKCQLSKRNKVDLSGKQYQYFKVISLSNVKNKDRFCWECLCGCGKTFYATTQFIVDGKKSSCGCKTKYMQSISAGGTGTPYENSDFYDLLRTQPEYFTWQKSVLKKYNKISGLTTSKSTLETHHIIPLNIIIKQYGITKENYTDHTSVLCWR